MESDVILNERLSVIRNDFSQDTLYLCLNGHDITLDFDAYVDLTGGIHNGGTLYLCDCKGGGSILQRENVSNRAFSNTGTMHMYGGEITGHDVKLGWSGGAVQNTGTFHMYDGKISKNSVDVQGKGGGVNNLGTFIMYGGESSNNYTLSSTHLPGGQTGGGIYNTADGVFTMYGGRISSNSARHGGGAYGEAGSTLNLLGGTIQNNRSLYAGDGVWARDCTVNVGGNITVTNNYYTDNKVCNLYLDNVTMNRSSELTGSIGVTVGTSPATAPVQYMTNMQDRSSLY